MPRTPQTPPGVSAKHFYRPGEGVVWMGVANFLGSESFIFCSRPCRSGHSVPTNVQQEDTSRSLFRKLQAPYKRLPRLRALRRGAPHTSGCPQRGVTKGAEPAGLSPGRGSALRWSRMRSALSHFLSVTCVLPHLGVLRSVLTCAMLLGVCRSRLSGQQHAMGI